MTVMFKLSLILLLPVDSRGPLYLDCKDDSFPDDFHFRVQFDSPDGSGPLLDDFNQRQDIVRGGVAFIDDKISVHIGDDGATDARSLEAEFVNQSAGRDVFRVLENATC